MPSASGWGHRATSPAATIPGDATSVGAHTTPSASSSPEPSSQSVTGMTPMATSTTSARRIDPSSRRRPSTRPCPTSPETPIPVLSSTPWSAWSSAIACPTSGPTTRPSGVASGSTTLTAAPRPRAVAATSMPRKPPPTTARRVPGATSSARSRTASPRLRSVRTPLRSGVPRSVRGVAPVATTSPSKRSSRPDSSTTDRVPWSRRRARSPRTSSRSRAASFVSLVSARRSSPNEPARNCLESGGRS